MEASSSPPELSITESWNQRAAQVLGEKLDANPVTEYLNLVHWTLSGQYDADIPVLIDAESPSRSISKRRAFQLIESLVGSFENRSTVCLHLLNDILYPVLVLAIVGSRCRWTGTNIAYTKHELAHHFEKSATRYVITTPEYLSTVQEAIKASRKAQIEIILFSDLLQQAPGPASASGGRNEAGTLRTLHDLTRSDRSTSLDKCILWRMLDEGAALMSTSGTTGPPKMTVRTHRAMMLEAQAIEDNNSAKPYEIRRLFSTPIFHGFSAPEMIFNSLRLGYPTYFMRKFDDTFAQKVRDFKISETAAPPPIMMRLLHQPHTHKLLQTLQHIWSGGTMLSVEQRLQILTIFERAPRIVQVWGMTEGGWFSTFKYPEVDFTGSVGRPVPGVEIKIAEDSRRDSLMLADGHTAGEIMVRGPQLMAGYMGDQTATQDTLDMQGWLKTGDIGYINDGKVYVIDRAKDLIKVNGWQVAPAEIEAVLLQSPQILDAAAISAGIGVDEHPRIFVVSKYGSGLSIEEVQGILLQRLARYKVAHIEVLFLNAIPRNPSGKILRQVLKTYHVSNNF